MTLKRKLSVRLILFTVMHIEERAGHASGKYVHDLSPYLLGWIIGVEWDPEVL